MAKNPLTTHPLTTIQNDKSVLKGLKGLILIADVDYEILTG